MYDNDTLLFPFHAMCIYSWMPANGIMYVHTYIFPSFRCAFDFEADKYSIPFFSARGYFTLSQFEFFFLIPFDIPFFCGCDRNNKLLADSYMSYQFK